MVGRAGVNNSFPEHNSATVRKIIMILARIGQHGVLRTRMILCLSSFSNYVP